jgi:hypothetical protein
MKISGREESTPCIFGRVESIRRNVDMRALLGSTKYRALILLFRLRWKEFFASKICTVTSKLEI